MVSFFSTAAFHWAGRTNFAPEQLADGLLPFRAQKLYYAAAPFLARADAEDAPKITLMPASLILTSSDMKAKKLEAFMQHKTQAGMFAKVKLAFDGTGDEEKYLLAAARGLPTSPLETDMFAAIEE
jgi:hypothetical protein